jgi:hypothetical protein
VHARECLNDYPEGDANRVNVSKCFLKTLKSLMQSESEVQFWADSIG